MSELAIDVILAAGAVFALGAISPGPSLMVVLRNTLIGGRRQGVMCALGHGLGFGVYAGTAVFGLIVLLEEAPQVFIGLQLIGAVLLGWYGWQMWAVDAGVLFEEHAPSARQGFTEGFAIAFFNPKIALFLEAVLASVLEEGMSMASKLAVGGLGMTIDAVWYVIVATVLSGTTRIDWLKQRAVALHRLTAIVLWAFGLSVLLGL